MKKSLVVVTLALAAGLALTGCTSSPAATKSTASVPTTTATAAAEVTSLNDAVAYALAVTTKTPLSEIGAAGAALKQYADASSKLTADQKSAADGFIAQSQQAVTAGDETSAGGDLQAAAQGVEQALSGD